MTRFSSLFSLKTHAIALLPLGMLSLPASGEEDNPTPPPAEAKASAEVSLKAEPRPVTIAPGLSIAAADLESIRLPQPKVLSKDLRITHMGVGKIIGETEMGENLDTTFVPTTKIPLVPETFFGWIIRFDTSRDSLTLKETFAVPTASNNWSHLPENTTLSRDGEGSTATTPKEFTPLWDWTSSYWGFEEGDPLGTHAFILHFDDEEIATLTFEVVTP